MNYFYFMEACYQTLTTIHDIVKSDPSPHTYLCTPREIILRHTLDWSIIEQHLKILVAENLVTIKQLDKIVVSITPDGIAKAKSLKNNFVNHSFSFPKEDNKFASQANGKS